MIIKDCFCTRIQNDMMASYPIFYQTKIGQYQKGIYTICGNQTGSVGKDKVGSYYFSLGPSTV